MKHRLRKPNSLLRPTRPLLRAARIALHGLAILALAGLAQACESIDNPRHLGVKPNYGNFVMFVQPVLAHRCASAACHGNPTRSFKVYALDFLRAPPEFAETPLDENHLTEAELTWNYDAVRYRLRGVTSLNTCKLLLKCLPLDQGGIVHSSGITVFSTKQDPDYKLLADWIDSELP